MIFKFDKRSSVGNFMIKTSSYFFDENSPVFPFTNASTETKRISSMWI